MIGVSDLKARVDLAALIEADLGPPYKQRGRWWWWCCPFHDDRNPSFGVTPDTGTWHCFGCGESGDHFTWLEKREGLTFVQAKDRLMALAGVLPEPSVPDRRRYTVNCSPTGDWRQLALTLVEECEAALWSDQGARARRWLHKRGLQDDTLRAWRLGYNSTDCKAAGLWLPRGIVIPCFVDGAVHYIKVRRPVPGVEGPRYQQVKGGRPTLYGLDVLDRKQVVVICEGELDALLLWQEARDLVDVVATGSAGNHPSLHHLSHLAYAATWLLAFDRDNAGEKGAEWWRDYSARVRRVRPLQGNDLTEFAQAGGDLRSWVSFHVERLNAQVRSVTASPNLVLGSRHTAEMEAEATDDYSTEARLEALLAALEAATGCDDKRAAQLLREWERLERLWLETQGVNGSEESRLLIQKEALSRWPEDPPPFDPCRPFGGTGNGHRVFWRRLTGGWVCTTCHPPPPGVEVQTWEVPK